MFWCLAQMRAATQTVTTTAKTQIVNFQEKYLANRPKQNMRNRCRSTVQSVPASIVRNSAPTRPSVSLISSTTSERTSLRPQASSKLVSHTPFLHTKTLRTTRGSTTRETRTSRYSTSRINSETNSIKTNSISIPKWSSNKPKLRLKLKPSKCRLCNNSKMHISRGSGTSSSRGLRNTRPGDRMWRRHRHWRQLS